MRVVGGKTGTDGRLFACIVWTVPGGEAEKGGLRQGDKILDWCGVSLVDRSFEEVCSIMDRTGDVVELLVEHASDFRMCDLLEDNSMQNNSVAVPPSAPARKNSEMINLAAGKHVLIFSYPNTLDVLNIIFCSKELTWIVVLLYIDVFIVIENENNDKSPASPTRRKLPKTPV